MTNNIELHSMMPMTGEYYYAEEPVPETMPTSLMYYSAVAEDGTHHLYDAEGYEFSVVDQAGETHYAAAPEVHDGIVAAYQVQYLPQYVDDGCREEPTGSGSTMDGQDQQGFVVAPQPREVMVAKEPSSKSSDYTCNICNLRLKYPSKIAAHMRTHSGEKPFECPHCGKRFSQRTPWMYHIKSKHIGDMPFRCEFCYKGFANKSSMTTHVNRVHLKTNSTQKVSLDSANFSAAMAPIDETIASVAEGKESEGVIEAVHPSLEKLTICSVCGEDVKYFSRLASHMKKHSPDKKLKCPMCDSLLGNHSALKIHVKRFHVSSEAVYCRWKCGRHFPGRAQRNEHEKIVHSRIRRFQCASPTCRMLFTRKTYVMSHIQKEHPGEFQTTPLELVLRVVAVPRNDRSQCFTVPQDFNRSSAHVINDRDGTPYIVQVIGPALNVKKHVLTIENSCLRVMVQTMSNDFEAVPGAEGGHGMNYDAGNSVSMVDDENNDDDDEPPRLINVYDAEYGMMCEEENENGNCAGADTNMQTVHLPSNFIVMQTGSHDIGPADECHGYQLRC